MKTTCVSIIVAAAILSCMQFAAAQTAEEQEFLRRVAEYQTRGVPTGGVNEKALCTEVWVSQAAGTNTSGTAGTEADPFKSITYALVTLANRATPDPWCVHVQAGTYDADPAKPVMEREVFPITLRPGMALDGEDGAANCIISGAHNPDSPAPLLRGEDLSGLVLSNLTLRDMATQGNVAAACQLIRCSVRLSACTFANNGSSFGVVTLDGPMEPVILEDLVFTGNQGGGLYISEGSLNGGVTNCTFSGNGNGIYAWHDVSGVTGCTFSGNGGSSIYAGGGGVSGVTGCTFSGNDGGIYAGGGDVSGVTGCTFSGNGHDGIYAGGGDVSGVTGCTFSGNGYDGIYAGGDVSGVTGCTFSGNGYDGMYAYVINGPISGNFFVNNGGCGLSVSSIGVGASVVRNAFIRNAEYGLNIRSSGAGGAARRIANNFFLGFGGGLKTVQEVEVINNTFWGDSGGGPSVEVASAAAASSFKNNIFAEAETGIWGLGPLTGTISHNDFSSIANIVYVNGQPFGNVMSEIEFFLPNFRDNYDWSPGFVNAYPGSTEVADFRLAAASQNIDAGVAIGPEEDYDGDPRPMGAGFDIGADEYAAPTVRFASSSLSAVEGVTSPGLTVTLAPAAASVVTVDYAVTGGTASGGGVDYTLSPGTLTFAAGEASQPIPFTVADDSVAEADETVVVTLSNVTGAESGNPLVCTYTILNDDEAPANTAPSVSVTTPSGTQAGTVSLSYTVSDAQSDRVSVTVTYNLNGGADQAATMGVGGDSASNLETSPSGVSHTFAWDSVADVGTVQGNVRLRLVANDGQASSADAQTDSFVVDNENPAIGVTGTVTDLLGGDPVSGVQVELRDAAASALLDTAATDASGAYAVEAPDETTPLAILFTHADYEPKSLSGFYAPITIDAALVPAAPQAPTGLRAVSGGEEILVQWNPNTEPDLAGYNVYRALSPGGPYTVLPGCPVGGTKYADAGLTLSQTYYYEVTALDWDGHESALAGPVQAQSGLITIWLPDVSGDPGECVRVPVNVDNATGIDPEGIDIDLYYYPAGVDVASIYVERTAVTATVAYEVNLLEAGRVRLSGIGGADTLSGEGHLFDVYLCLIPEAEEDTCGLMGFNLAKFYDPTPTLLATDYTDTALLCVNPLCQMGDLNNDGMVDSADVLMCLQIAVGLIIPQGCQLQAGDLNGDRVIDSADAIMVQRLAVGLPINPAQPGEAKGYRGASLAAVLGNKPQVTVSLPGASAAPGQSCAVPVLLSVPAGLSGFDVLVSYPPGAGGLSLEGVEGGGLTGDFRQKVNYGEGYVKVSMSRSTALAGSKSGEENSLAILQFRVSDTAQPGAVLPLGLNGVELKGQYGDSFRWYTEVGQVSGEVTVLAAGAEGEGEGEGEGSVPEYHTADQNHDGLIGLSELLRVIQFYNSGGLHCADEPGSTEDGYAPGPGVNHTCAPHASDYAPSGPDWQVTLTELLRVIQFYNSSGYHWCPGEETEDGYCPGQ